MSAVEAIRILIVDDHAMVREGIGRVLRDDGGFEIRSCGSVAEAVHILQSGETDLLLLDYDLGGERATDLLAQLERIGFQGPTVVLTAHVGNLAATQLVHSGVSGILLKVDSASVLGSRLRDIHAGATWFDIGMETLLRLEETAPSSRAEFTRREKETLHEIVDGLSNKEIAFKYAVSESAVKATIQRLFFKTGARTRSQLVRLALERDLDSTTNSAR